MRSLNIRTNYRIVGGDFSAQEPRLTAFYSQDPQMIDAYRSGKDLYAVIASAAFNVPYEDCLEFYPEGTKINYEGKEVTCGHKTHQNKEGKQRRTAAKSILLGILYGRGAASIGEQIGKNRDEAQEIVDKFFQSFPNVKRWIDKTIADAHKYGYVEDIAGRRRRLPDIMLPKYDITTTSNESEEDFNPLLGCKNRVNQSYVSKISKYKKLLESARNRKDVEKIQQQALSENIVIKDNTGFIAQAERQAVNSKVQGGAATLTKLALIYIYRDQRLKDIGAKLINTVHDEILLEVPECNSKLAEDLLTQDMIESAKSIVTNVPMKTDTYNETCWYLSEFVVLVDSEFKKMLNSGMSEAEAFEKMCYDRSESTRDQIYEIVKGYLHYMPENVKIIKTF